MSAKAVASRTRSSEGGAVHVALLRGINVGGKNRLPMADLAAMFRAAGCTDVETYIQSGNVVWRAPGKAATAVAASVVEAIGRRAGLDVPVVVRSAAELRAVALGNPFLRARGAAPAPSPEFLHVAFLADAPPAARVAGLDGARSPGDSFAVRGREIYLHLPGGVGKTKLTNAYFDKALATVSTVRNWKTVLALADLAGSVG